MSVADAADRAEILASFQACTGIDDVSVAVAFLEESGWNLLTAVHRVVPEHSQTLPSERSTVDRSGTVVASGSTRIEIGGGDPRHFPSKMSKKSDSPSNDIPPTSSITPSQIQIPNASEAITSALNDSSSNSEQGFNTTPSLPTVPIPGASTAKPHVIDVESSDSEVEDLTESYQDEEFLLPETNGSTRSRRFLIADNVGDETTGTIIFSDNFQNRYGHCHPMFYHGPLDAAVKEATIRPAKDRKLLAIYLHHDESVLSNIFCTQVLCTEPVVNLLSLNFVVWGWDVTHESNRSLFLTATNKSFGPSGVDTIRQIAKDRYPVIIIVSRVRATTEICDIIHGSNGVDDIMSRLLHCLEIYRAQQLLDVHEEEERETRERVIQEQNEAYQESLRADIAKEEAKKAQELEKKRGEEEKLAAIALADAQRKQVSSTLPPEPGPNSTEPICTLRTRFPNGKVGSRKFLQSTPVKVLYDYLFSEGFSKNDYKVLFSHPKRDLTELHRDDELMGKVFRAQDTIILEER